MSSGARPALGLRDARKRFGEQTILAGVSLTIPRGQTVALVGPSGSGKTTLLRVLAGMLPLDAGTLEVDGEVGMLYQNDALVPGLRAVHNVLVGRLRKWSLWKSLVSLLVPRELERARAALAAVDLADKLWSPIGALSGGQRQRVALARLLAQEATVVLADEPAAALDPRLRHQVVELLLRLAKERGTTLLVSLHEMELVEAGFDRVLALRDGRWFHDGTSAALDAEARARLFAGEAVPG